MAVEVAAGTFGAGRGEAEDLRWWDRLCHGEELVGDRDRFFKPRDARFFRVLRVLEDDAEGHATGHGGLRTRTERWLLGLRFHGAIFWERR